MNMPNLNGILTKKMVGEAAGAYIYYDAIGKPYNRSGIDVASDMINNLGNLHMPDLNSLVTELTAGTLGHQAKQYAKLWALGYGLKSVGIGAKYGNMAQKFSENAIKGMLKAAVVGFSTAWNSPPDGSGKNSVTRNFLSAKPINAYQYSY